MNRWFKNAKKIFKEVVCIGDDILGKQQSQQSTKQGSAIAGKKDRIIII
jgi:hypothetical protein